MLAKDRNIEAHIVARLGHLNHHRPAPAELRPAPQGGIRPLKGLHRQHHPLLDQERLPNIQRADPHRRAVAKVDILRLARIRRARSQHAHARQMRAHKARGRNHLRPARFHLLDNAPKDGVRVLDRQFGENPARQGIKAGAKERGRGNLPGEQHIGHAPLLEPIERALQLAHPKDHRLIGRSQQLARGHPPHPRHENTLHPGRPRPGKHRFRILATPGKN